MRRTLTRLVVLAALVVLVSAVVPANTVCSCSYTDLFGKCLFIGCWQVP